VPSPSPDAPTAEWVALWALLLRPRADVFGEGGETPDDQDPDQDEGRGPEDLAA
jgi:hypothetical protein